MIHSSDYFVADKYTLANKRQTDFHYRQGVSEPSQNRITGRLHAIYDLPFLSDFALTAEEPMTFACSFPHAVTGFYLQAQTVSDPDAILCVTFFGETDGESFMTVCRAGILQEKPMFHSLPMTFVPRRVLFSLSAGNVSALSIGGCHVLNPLGIWSGQQVFYRAKGCELRQDGTDLCLHLQGEGELESPLFPNCSTTAYNMLMPRRNTVYAVIDNRSSADRVTLFYTTHTYPDYDGAAGVTLSLAPGKHAYYFNLSETPHCEGRLRSFRLCLNGQGTVRLCSYSFEEEKVPERLGGRIFSCRATAETVTVRGILYPQTLQEFAGGTVRIYALTMADDRDVAEGNPLVGECPIAERFCIDDIPNSDGIISRLPYQFLAFAEKDGRRQKIDDRFLIENYEDFCPNPYAFRTPGYEVNVCNCGAAGDGFTDDTEAIQRAIDMAAKMGGGRVTVPGDDSFYGRRYIVTNLLLRSLVELHIEKGAVLWQSQNPYHYCYHVTYGHDAVIPGVNWTHCMHVCNLPTIQCHHAHKVKVTGFGAIRSMDTGSEEGVAMPGYSTGCPDRIHQISLGFYEVTDLELRDFSILRANNYHFSYYCSSRVYIANLKMYQVKCVSGDGPGCQSSHHVCITRCLFQSNDDGVNFTAVYHDPRGIVWWTSRPGEDNSNHHFLITNNYLNSGGGKAIAFITWGTDDPDQERTQISDIEVYGNHLVAINPVGAWHDNPYRGKVPFDNTETDDYSPVTRVRILGNRYEGNCTVGPIRATDMITDCGIHSASDFRNGDFSLGGFANWNLTRNSHPASARTVIFADKRKGLLDEQGEGNVSAEQGLFLEAGTHTVSAEVSCGDTGGYLFVRRIDTGETVAEKKLLPGWMQKETLSFSLAEETDVYIGFRTAGTNDGYVMFDDCRVNSCVDREAAVRRKTQALCRQMQEVFCLPAQAGTVFENGKPYLTLNGAQSAAILRTVIPFSNLHLACAVRIDAVANQAAGKETVSEDHPLYGSGPGFLFGAGETSCYLLRMYMEQKELRLLHIVNGEAQCLWKRENFFFTSYDFHRFDLTVLDCLLTLRVDSALCGQITLPASPDGYAAILISGLHTTLTGICAETP